MAVIIGLVIVFGSILVGFTMAHGKIAALIQIAEFVSIFGAAFGSIVIGYSFKGAIGMLKAIVGLLKGNPFKKNTYLELLQCMYELFATARKEGLLSLEKHVEEPGESEIIQKYPSFGKNHHAIELFADSMKLVVMGGVSTYDLADLMEIDMEAMHEEAMKNSNILSTTGDAMPGFGIVAAVLGVVVTMQSIGGPPEEVGEKVGAALVGTFLGVLLAYGLFSPLARATEAIAKNEAQYLACIKNAVVAFCRGDAPLVCVEFARRNIEPELRPKFKEMEDTVKGRTESASVDAAKAA